MKNQYFGDIRDLFKYDLIQHLIESVESLAGLTFIPMLTPDDGGGQGNVLDYDRALAGNRNESLKQYLGECVSEDRRDIREVRQWFESQDVSAYLYEPTTHLERTVNPDYFDEISDEKLADALVFVDPDIGLEINDFTEAHILFKEVKGLFRRMGERSALMIFQFVHHFVGHEQRPVYFAEKHCRLSEETGASAVHIFDGSVAFFLLGKTSGMTEALAGAIRDYNAVYPRLTVGPETHPAL